MRLIVTPCRAATLSTETPSFKSLTIRISRSAFFRRAALRASIDRLRRSEGGEGDSRDSGIWTPEWTDERKDKHGSDNLEDNAEIPKSWLTAPAARGTAPPRCDARAGGSCGPFVVREKRARTAAVYFLGAYSVNCW